jgi:D-alanine-D-alanine ligase
MADVGRVVVLAGGLSHERDISLRSGGRVADALRDRGTAVQVRDADAAFVRDALVDPPDVVLPLLHGSQGEDGALRAVLELLGLPFVGTPASSCRSAFDKPTANEAVARAGLSVPRSVVLPHAAFRDLGADALLQGVLRTFGLPLVVKPARGGSALGCSIVRSESDLPSAMVGCFAYGEDALIQRLVEGTEVAVSVLEDEHGARALPVVEIVPDGPFYDYQARYTAGATEFFVPARLPEQVLAAAAEAALAAHAVLGLRDLSRTDLIVDGNGEPWFLEVNVAPGMTETSLFPLAVEGAGDGLGPCLEALLERARARGVRAARQP